MKVKMVLAALLFAASAAQAVEVGVVAGRTFDGADRNGVGLTLGTKANGVGVTAGFQRFNEGTRQDRWTLVGSYDVTKVGPATLAVKAGGAFLDNSGSVSNGYALVAGAGVSYPLNKTVSLTADYFYQHGQDRVDQFNGSNVTAGLKFAF